MSVLFHVHLRLRQQFYGIRGWWIKGAWQWARRDGIFAGLAVIVIALIFLSVGIRDNLRG